MRRLSTRFSKVKRALTTVQVPGNKGLLNLTGNIYAIGSSVINILGIGAIRSLLCEMAHTISG